MKLTEILSKEENNNLTQFTEQEIAWLENRIYQGVNDDGKPVARVNCIIREKEIEVKPEEIVRQLFVHKLIEEYCYPKDRIELERIVAQGRETDKRADIVIYEDEFKTAPYIVVECKAPGKKKVEGQLESYCKYLGASIAVELDGGDVKEYYFNRQSSQNKNYKLEEIDRIPKFNETLDQILNHSFTIKDLIIEDEKRTTSLKDVILELEDKIFANFGGDVFEEVFKFLFAKLYDEYCSAEDNDRLSNAINDGFIAHVSEFKNDTNFRQLEFRSLGSEYQVLNKIQNLFKNAQNEWDGIFPDNTKFELGASDVKIVVSYLENIKLFNSNLDVVDDAFEHLMKKSQKAEKGQFFTPRYVIDMCVKMMNPTERDAMIDTASGSCGFPMHTIFHVWNKMNPQKHNFVNTKRSRKETKYVNDKVFAIDYDEVCVRVGKMLNIIAGDGKTNVIELNTLDYNVWNGSKYLKKEGWSEKYIKGFQRLEGYATNDEKGSYRKYDFDLVLANPPFAGDRTDPKVIGLYTLGYNDKGKLKNKIGRDILFVERNLNFLRPGGRMGLVLPEGDFNNSSEKYLRDFIAEKCRILAVVGLHPNTFLQHTAGIKTSVLFVQKWDDKLCPKVDDYNIFFATMQEPTVNNKKEKIYVTENYVTWTKYTYSVKDGKIVQNATEQKTKWGSTDFVQDLFIEDYGELSTHRKWIRKPVTFKKKPLSKKDAQNMKLLELADEITLDEWIASSADSRRYYKELVNGGKDCDSYMADEIGPDEYAALPKEMQKFYLMTENVKERNSVRLKDTHGHIFVKHDLYNHDPELDALWTNRDERLKGRYSKDGIAEAFAEFAKKEGFSFF